MAKSKKNELKNQASSKTTPGHAKDRTKQKQQNSSGQSRKVWRIFHFEQRFEMDEYRRQGGLDYIRMFVTATTIGKSNESTEFFQQLTELRHFYPDDYYKYLGIFWTLAGLTATREDWLRGYLLDGDLTPLTESKLAARLQISLKDTKAALIALKKVGLIEYIPCPEFNKPVRDKKKDQNQKQAKIRQSNKSKSEPVTSKKAAIREHSQTFGNVSKALNNKNKKRIKREINNNLKRKTDLNKTEKTNPIENLKKIKNKKNSKTQPQTSIKSVETENVNDKYALSTKTEIHKQTQELKLVNPMESEATAASSHHVPKQPSSAFKQGDPQHIGRIISRRFPEHWRDPDAEAFGWEIVEALGMSTDRENQQSRAEWGAFASWWSRLKQVIPSVVYEELRAVAIAKAEYVRTKGKSAHNKSAVWFGIVARILSSRGISLPPARASLPVSV